MFPIWFLMALVILVCLVFWMSQSIKLMSMSDSQFPGRYDKILWTVILLAAGILGAGAFWIWRASGRADQRVQAETEAAVKRTIAMHQKPSETNEDTQA